MFALPMLRHPPLLPTWTVMRTGTRFCIRRSQASNTRRISLRRSPHRRTTWLGRNHEQVFHHTTVEDQAKVIRKANAYAELIITSNCRYKMPEQPKGKRVSYVKAYLDGMTNAEVVELQEDTRGALEDLEDTNRSMAVYRDGDDLLERVRASCFTLGQQGLLSKDAYKPMDGKTRLHARLAFPKLYCIPVGFYYAKWLEKLEYYLRNNTSRGLVLTSRFRLRFWLSSTAASLSLRVPESRSRKALSVT
jgi:hypothetical protein